MSTMPLWLPRHLSGAGLHTAVRSQKAVTAHFTSEQLLPFGFAERHRDPGGFTVHVIRSLVMDEVPDQTIPQRYTT